MAAVERIADEEWESLVTLRAPRIRRFLQWAARTEQRGGDAVVRLCGRDDLRYVRQVLDSGAFAEPWWAIAVYTAVDRREGALWLGSYLPTPVDARTADELVPAAADWPKGTIGGHRTQAGNGGARDCVLSMCQYDAEIARIGRTMSSVEDAVQQLLVLRARQVGRTTAFDLALRAGQFLHPQPIEPAIAHLKGSTGPATGFDQVWGFNPAGPLSGRGEGVVRRWTSEWDEVAAAVDVEWPWRPFSAGDLENALCIYQDRALHHRFGSPETSAA